MANKMHLQQKTKQRMIPQTVQCLKLLALPVTALEQFLTASVAENPLLELDYENTSLNNIDEESDSWEQARNTDESESPEEGLIEIECSIPLSSNPGNYKKNGDINNILDYFIRSEPETETLAGFLELQLSLCTLSQIETQIGLELIGNINDSGYFVGNLQMIAGYYGQHVCVAERVLKELQRCYPLGIGARDIKECLILQADPSLPDYSLLIDIIRNDLDDLAHHSFGKVARKYRISKLKAQQLLDYISTLNPKPGNMFNDGKKTGYIIPDIIIRHSGETFSVYLNGNTDNILQINQQYLNLNSSQTVDSKTQTYIRSKYSEAQTLIRSLEMRHHMLRDFALFLLKEQQAFIKQGSNMLRPLTMQQAADYLGVSVSTISRTVNGKYIQTPWGIYPLKYFFSGGFDSEKDKKVSSRIIKEYIRKMIALEDPYCPLSDAGIAQELDSQGISISRRTVAKYRQSLGYDGQNERKRYN